MDIHLLFVDCKNFLWIFYWLNFRTTNNYNNLQRINVYPPAGTERIDLRVIRKYSCDPNTNGRKIFFNNKQVATLTVANFPIIVRKFLEIY